MPYVATRRGNRSTSLLLPFLLNDNLPPAFLSELVVRTCDDPDAFEHIFVPLLRSLMLTVRRLSFDTHDYKQPLTVLSALCDIKIGNTRPLCNLVSVLCNVDLLFLNPYWLFLNESAISINIYYYIICLIFLKTDANSPRKLFPN